MRAIAIMGLVQRLLANEASEHQAQEALTQEREALNLTAEQEALSLAAERAADKLRLHLSKRIGQEGIRTLLARALSITTLVYPQLSAVRVEANGSLVGLREAIDDGSQESEHRKTRNSKELDNATDGAVALIANLLGLLIAFIGEDLTLRMLSTVWPELALPELDLDDLAFRENETP